VINRPGGPVPSVARNGAVRVDHELLGCFAIEIPIALLCLIERNHGDVGSLGNFDFVVENRHHQLTVILHHRTLVK
jgi:hypothetical protein